MIEPSSAPDDVSSVHDERYEPAQYCESDALSDAMQHVSFVPDASAYVVTPAPGRWFLAYSPIALSTDARAAALAAVAPAGAFGATAALRDAFAAFEEVGLENEEAVRETGRRFRKTVLALGGGRHPSDVFRDFRGRDPSPDALLKHSGLL